MMRFFAKLLVLAITLCCPGVAQAQFPANASLLTASQGPVVGQIMRLGGLYFDFLGGNFLVQQTAGGIPTRYANFAAMYAALSGSLTSSAKWVYNGSGVLTEFPANTPAQPCYGGGGQVRGWCLEAASKNWLLWSGDFSNAAYTKTGVTVAASSRLAPTQLAPAWKLTETSANSNHWVIQSVTKAASALNYVATCHVGLGAGSRNFLIYMDDGTGSNGAYAIYEQSIFDDETPSTDALVATTFGTWSQASPDNPISFLDRAGTSGMARIGLSATTNTTTTIRYACGLANGTSLSYVGSTTQNIDAWGAQLEQRTAGGAQRIFAPSSYISTTTVAVDRVLDQTTLQLPASLQSQSEYALFANVFLPRFYNQYANAFVSLANADESEHVFLNQSSNATASRLGMTLVVDGITDGIPTSGPQNLYNQRFGIVGQLRSGAWWVKNSSSSNATSTAALTFEAATQIRLNGENTGQTTSGNTGYIQVALVKGLAQTADREILSSFLSDSLGPNPDLNIPPNYFTQGMIDDVTPAGLMIFRSNGMPSTNNMAPASYPYYPSTVTFSNNPQVDLFQSAVTDTAYAYRLWGVRCDLCPDTSNIKPNEVAPPLAADDSPARMRYSTYTKAIWAEITQMLYYNNFPQFATGPCTAPLVYCGWQDAAVGGGGFAPADLIPYSYAEANASTVFPDTFLQFRVNTDKIILPINKIADATTPNVWGTLSVSEMADRRSAADMLFLQQQKAAIAHQAGYKYALITDDLLGSGASAGFCGYSTAVVSATGNVVADNATITGMSNTTNIGVGQRLRGTGIPTQAVVLSKTATSVTFDHVMTATGVGVSITSPDFSPNCETTNLNEIISVVDYVMPSVGRPTPRGYSLQQNLDAQIALFGGSGSFDATKLGFTWGMGQWPGGTSPADAQIGRAWFLLNGLGAQAYSSGFAGWGGQMCRWTNLKIEILSGLSTGDCVIPP